MTSPKRGVPECAGHWFWWTGRIFRSEAHEMRYVLDNGSWLCVKRLIGEAWPGKAGEYIPVNEVQGDWYGPIPSAEELERLVADARIYREKYETLLVDADALRAEANARLRAALEELARVDQGEDPFERAQSRTCDDSFHWPSKSTDVADGAFCPSCYSSWWDMEHGAESASIEHHVAAFARAALRGEGAGGHDG